MMGTTVIMVYRREDPFGDKVYGSDAALKVKVVGYQGLTADVVQVKGDSSVSVSTFCQLVIQCTST